MNTKQEQRSNKRSNVKNEPIMPECIGRLGKTSEAAGTNADDELEVQCLTT
jgi:hypothetical protein